MTDRPNLVAGRILPRSLADFEEACLSWIDAEQGELLPDNAAISLLSDAVRLAREVGDRRRGRAEPVAASSAVCSTCYDTGWSIDDESNRRRCTCGVNPRRGR